VTGRTFPDTTFGMSAFELRAALSHYTSGEPDECAACIRFLELIVAEPRCLWRDAFPAHFTASAWLVSADGERALLMHHRKLDRWLQPGGHADGDANLPQVALREADEETGLRGLSVDPSIFDLDAHEIPARMSEPAHWHYDVRFVVRCTGSGAFNANDESRAMTWRPVSGIAMDAHIDPSIRRMARRWLARTR
jgi:8-oxo-dGTP pyrophosphatase MutT (NUDIX family)